MNRFLSAALFLFCSSTSVYSTVQDTVRMLDEVVVKAYGHDRPAAVVPAAVAVFGKEDFTRFSNTSLLPLLNNQPGIRMEERSPGSYRLSIRGSSLRSPFGVRNVKIYWNGMPLTDPGGNTYLNLLDLSGMDQMEVIRGPGSSLYGAGTGGVVLLSSGNRPERIRAEISGGGYGLFRASGGYHGGDARKSIDVRVSHQSSDGYRVQSAMQRNVVQVAGHLAAGKKTTLSLFGFSSALRYQTPGGLTLVQYNADPAQARPAAGINPGAVEQQAAVDNATTFGGFTAEHQHSERWNSTVTVFGNTTAFSNPAIRNYEQRSEKSIGFRWVSAVRFDRGKFSFGAESQWGGSSISVHKNLSGVKGDLLNKAEAPATTGLLFAQADVEWPSGFFLTGGLSLNRFRVKFSQSVPTDFSDVQEPSVVLIPRLALSRQFSKALVLYASAGQGFSPPTVAEVFPSTASYSKTLRAERGTNLEAGAKGSAGPVEYSLSVYRMKVASTIVVRRDESGADFFINAGETLQQGAEAMMAIRFAERKDWLRDLRGWMTWTRTDYRFLNYVRGTDDFSGNRLTGTPRNTATAGLEWMREKGFRASFSAQYAGKLPLNDANTDVAPEYYTLAARIAYTTRSTRYPMEIFAGGENLLDRRYSLGHDLNAVAGRYYNAAPGRMVYAGLSVRVAR